MIFISGGVRSGKSSFAEKLAKSFNKQKVYLATMKVYDTEMKQRVNKHIEDRKNDDYITIEKEVNITKELNINNNQIVLLDCLTNLVANEMFILKKNKDDIIKDITNDLLKIDNNSFELIIVSNDIFSGFNDYNKETNTFIETLGLIHQNITKLANECYEVIYNIPKKIKG